MARSSVEGIAESVLLTYIWVLPIVWVGVDGVRGELLGLVVIGVSSRWLI
jgi:hypothetical protein